MSSRHATSGSARGRRVVLSAHITAWLAIARSSVVMLRSLWHVQPEDPPLGSHCRPQATRYLLRRRDRGRIVRGPLSPARLRCACTALARHTGPQRQIAHQACLPQLRQAPSRKVGDLRALLQRPVCTSTSSTRAAAARRRHAHPGSNIAPVGMNTSSVTHLGPGHAARQWPNPSLVPLPSIPAIMLHSSSSSRWQYPIHFSLPHRLLSTCISDLAPTTQPQILSCCYQLHLHTAHQTILWITHLVRQSLQPAHLGTLAPQQPPNLLHSLHGAVDQASPCTPTTHIRPRDLFPEASSNGVHLA